MRGASQGVTTIFMLEDDLELGVERFEGGLLVGHNSEGTYEVSGQFLDLRLELRNEARINSRLHSCTLEIEETKVNFHG